MVSRKEFYLAIGAVLVFTLLAFGVIVLRQHSTTGISSWLAEIHEVGQPGSTVDYLTRKMGPPDATYNPGKLSDRDYTDSSWRIPTQTTKIYYYEYGMSRWMVYFFIGSSGDVLGYSLRST